MNIRFLSVFIIAASISIMLFTFFMTEPEKKSSEPTPPFFYTISPKDMNKIHIKTNNLENSWYFDDELNRWFFENLNKIPTDLYRWGGITQLLSGPKTQRVISQQIDDPIKYGLDDPKTEIKLYINDGTYIKLLIGNLTPDQEKNYAQIEGYPQLVVVDALWDSVLSRLVEDPPYPDWYISGIVEGGKPTELLLFKNNEVIRGYGANRETGIWSVCEIPPVSEPCRGNELANGDVLLEKIDKIANPEIVGAHYLDIVQDENLHKVFGTTVNDPYIYVRIERLTEKDFTEVTGITMTIGNEVEGENSRYAMIMETLDVVKVNKEWADSILTLFDEKVLYK
tara:strand:- start:1094 stop:2110 length:1017 start_codon:yes stop_codon:yes gene_type:complete